MNRPGRALTSCPSSSICFGLRKWMAKHNLMSIPFILFLFVLIGYMNSFWYQKIPNKFTDKFIFGFLAFLFFFFDDFFIYLICEFYMKCESGMRYIPIFFIKKYVWFVFNSNFTGLFTNIRNRNTMFFFCIT